MRGPILIVDGYLVKDDCTLLRQQYEHAVNFGELQPRGTLTTDVALSLVAKLVRVQRCCGVAPLDLRELRDGVGKRLTEYFELAPLIPDYSAYTRVKAGGLHVLHADSCLLDGSPNHTPHRVASAVLYLSEAGADFWGGELGFPDRELKIVPRPGRLVAFESTLANQHYVSRVSGGVRDALAFWFTHDPRRCEHWPS